MCFAEQSLYEKYLKGTKLKSYPIIPSLSLGLLGLVLFVSEAESHFDTRGVLLISPAETAVSTGCCNELVKVI